MQNIHLSCRRDHTGEAAASAVDGSDGVQNGAYEHDPPAPRPENHA